MAHFFVFKKTFVLFFIRALEVKYCWNGYLIHFLIILWLVTQVNISFTNLMNEKFWNKKSIIEKDLSIDNKLSIIIFVNFLRIFYLTYFLWLSFKWHLSTLLVLQPIIIIELISICNPTFLAVFPYCLFNFSVW